jgi:hypothetical protein
MSSLVRDGSFGKRRPLGFLFGFGLFLGVWGAGLVLAESERGELGHYGNTRAVPPFLISRFRCRQGAPQLDQGSPDADCVAFAQEKLIFYPDAEQALVLRTRFLGGVELLPAVGEVYCHRGKGGASCGLGAGSAGGGLFGFGMAIGGLLS